MCVFSRTIERENIDYDGLSGLDIIIFIAHVGNENVTVANQIDYTLMWLRPGFGYICSAKYLLLQI